jgi:hypothetical protein
MSDKIFFSYRREDKPGFALALYSRLDQTFPSERLLMDIEGGTAAGQDFVQVLEARVSACDAMLVLIGPKWLSAPRVDSGRLIQRFSVAHAEHKVAGERSR